MVCAARGEVPTSCVRSGFGEACRAARKGGQGVRRHPPPITDHQPPSTGEPPHCWTPFLQIIIINYIFTSDRFRNMTSSIHGAFIVMHLSVSETKQDGRRERCGLCLVFQLFPMWHVVKKQSYYTRDVCFCVLNHYYLCGPIGGHRGSMHTRCEPGMYILTSCAFPFLDLIRTYDIICACVVVYWGAFYLLLKNISRIQMGEVTKDGPFLHW